MDIFELFPSAISIWTNEAFVQLWGTVVTWFNELLTSFIAMPIEKKIGQILGIIVTIGCIVIAQLPKRSQILTAQAFLNVVSAVNLLLVSDGMSGLTASLPCFVAVVHCSVNVIRERKSKKFSSFEDFLKRMSEYDINKRMVETLIKSGAFDNLGVYRSKLLQSYEHLINVLTEKNRNNISGQLDMFSMPSADNSLVDSPEFEYPDIPEYSLKELLMLEKESSGMYFSGHPIESYKNHSTHLGLGDLSLLLKEEELADRKPIKIAAMITSVTVKNTRKNEKMAFVTVEDRFGEVECILFSTQYTKFMHHLRVDTAIMVEGVVSIRDDETPRIVVSNIDELTENSRFIVPQKTISKPTNNQPVAKIEGIPQKIYLKVPSMESKECRKIINLVDIFPGTTKVIFYNSENGKYVSYSNGILLSEVIVSELCELLGKENVVIK